MKPGVHLVNIARGSIIDQDALHDALDTRVGETWQVGMASLDVTTPEPLPAGHWLFSHPRVRLSPHVSWIMPRARDQLDDAFRKNLTWFLRGEALEGIVDTALGY
jgi:phosphoglycerate dehydrogenase-like enzyme